MDPFYEALILQINRLGIESRYITGIPQLMGRRARIQTQAWTPPRYTGCVMSTVREKVNHHSTSRSTASSCLYRKGEMRLFKGRCAVLSQLVCLVILSLHKILLELQRGERHSYACGQGCHSLFIRTDGGYGWVFFFNFLKTFTLCIGA